ncbi:hypothetical protein VRB67_22470 [Pseudomonas trivialis]
MKPFGPGGAGGSNSVDINAGKMNPAAVFNVKGTIDAGSKQDVRAF